MSEASNAYMHTEGDPNDILFLLPPASRTLREGDTFTVTDVGGAPVVYKVESVDYRLVRLASGNLNNPHDFWKSPEVYYGVTIVLPGP